MEDAMRIEQQLDNVKEAMVGKEQQILRNVGLYD